MLGHSYKQFTNWRGTFVGDITRPDLSNHIFMLMKYDSRDFFVEYEENLMKHRSFVEKYDPDNYSVMFVYKVPKEYQEDYDVFKASKYSKFSDAYKRKIVKFWGLMPTHKWFKVMYRDASLVKQKEEELDVRLAPDAEVVSLMNPSIEYYSDDFKLVNPLAASLEYGTK